MPVAPQRVKQRRELGQCRGQRLKLPQDYLEQFPVTESYRLGYFSHAANIAPAWLELGRMGVLTGRELAGLLEAAMARCPAEMFVPYRYRDPARLTAARAAELAASDIATARTASRQAGRGGAGWCRAHRPHDAKHYQRRTMTP